MREPSNDPDAGESAEDLFLDFLTRREETGAEDFEDFCARYPARAEALRVLHADLQCVGGLIAKSNKQQSMQAALASAFGKSLDPGISLEPARGASESIVERLEEHATGASRYEIEDEVARGGMGVILKAWDRDLRRSMAMKAMLSGYATEAGGTRPEVNEMHLRRFLEEAQITGQLEHPGIVPVHELGIDSEGRVYFTMPLIRGREFKHIISLVRDGAEGWTLTKALHVLQKVCEAVAYAHAKGVIHRDLKPANIMVGSFGETYVMDWGLARVLDREDTRDIRVRPPEEPAIETERTSGDTAPVMTMDGTVIGTPAYMSPEQAAGHVEQLDERTDVYALGAMLYHLLACQMPYGAPGQPLSPHAVLRARLSTPPLAVAEINPEAPTEVVEICEKAMSDAPQERYRTALEFSEDIEAYLGGRPVSAHERSLGYQLRLAFNRHRTAFVTAIVSTLILIAGTVMFVRSQQRALRDRTRALDSASVDILPAQVEDLFPVLPETVPSMLAWLERVEDLLSREEDWRAELGRADAEQHAGLEQMLSGMGALHALRDEVQQRVSAASALEDPEHLGRAASWTRAIEKIASSPVYEGLVLREIPGLLPLGQDLASGYFEFWNYLSGSKPHRDPVTGRLDPRPEDGVVLVLLPGVTFTMGNLDDLDESPTVEVTLEPYLLGKYEVTRGQWGRIMKSDPSMYAAGFEAPTGSGAGASYELGALHPVTNVTWFRSADFCERVALSLPSEAQWEYGARAGSSEMYYWGASPADVRGRENVYNEACFPLGFGGFAGGASWSDGFCSSAPIGSFEPNELGLHDTLANVAEWCAEWLPEDPIGVDKRKLFRGSSYLLGPEHTYPDWRQYRLPSMSNESQGLRVARALDE